MVKIENERSGVEDHEISQPGERNLRLKVFRRLRLPFEAIARAYSAASDALPKDEDQARQEREAREWVRNRTTNYLP